MTKTGTILRAACEPLESRLMLARALGIDVYSGDGTINWTSVKNAGYSFAWAKATEGTGFTDSKFTTNMANASAVGLPIGPYDYARWDTHLGTAGASEEEDYFWSIVGSYYTPANAGKYLAPVLDLERGPNGLEPPQKGYNKTTFSAWANQWLQDFVDDAAAQGVTVTPIIYTGVTFANAYLDTTISQKWPLWMSNYVIGADPQTGDPSGTTPWTQWQFFQYSATGAVPGVPATNVDKDVIQGDTEVLKNYIVGSPGRFEDGAWVKVNTGALNAWNNPTSGGGVGDSATAIPQDTIGRVLQGPYYAKSFQRWQVQWNYVSGGGAGTTTGWSAEYQDGDGSGTDWMVALTPTAATNGNPTGSLTSLPTNFTWTAATYAASYDVYLDGKLQGNVTTPSWAHGAISNGSHTWHVIANNGPNHVDSALWSFSLSTPGPGVTNVTSISANGAYKAGTIIPLKVQFAAAVTVTGIPQLALNSGATVNYSGGSGTNTLSFNYTVAAGQNSSDLDYLSAAALTLNGGTIKDATSNNATLTLPTPGSSGSLGFNKDIIVDTAAPGASYGGQTPGMGNATLDFTMTYTDSPAGVNVGSFDDLDVTVTGPGGFSANATFISVDVGSNGSPRVATYRITAPGGTWGAPDNGTYTVSQNASQVSDIANNVRPAGTIGTFALGLPFAYITGGTLHVEYAPGTGDVSFTSDGTNILVTENAGALPFAPGTFNDIVVHGTSLDDAILIGTSLPQPLTLDGQTGADSITIGAGGSHTFASDAAAMTANLGIYINAGGSATFSANQHLEHLTVAGTAALPGGPGKVIVARSLSVTGSLDLAGNNLIVDYIGPSVLGSWDGTAYTGVSGLVASGKVQTSLADSLHSLGVAEASDVLGPGGGTFFGESADSTAILVKFTYGGDANLDGKLNIDDYTHVDQGIAGLSASWINGDFNYDGKINIDDYVIIDGNIQVQGSPL